ncbi:MAG: CHAD domain-containing protein, partial [Gemmataceae bacterium]|nr:CHAD domain-containing protein [Gemmataceae bacterium]
MADGKWMHDLPAGTRLHHAAQAVLGTRLEAVRDALEPALRNAAADVEHVHKLRVATRRARAALDLFRACLSDPVYRRVKKALRKIRRAAGAARDWDVFLADLVTTRPGRGSRI